MNEVLFFLCKSFSTMSLKFKALVGESDRSCHVVVLFCCVVIVCVCVCVCVSVCVCVCVIIFFSPLIVYLYIAGTPTGII